MAPSQRNCPLMVGLLPMKLSPPPPPSPETSFPILAMSIVGILTTAILLLSYYVFVIKCCLNSHRFDAIRRLSYPSRRRWSSADALSFSAIYTERGLDESVIQAIPTLQYRRGEQQNNSFHECCAVCLNEFQEEERIRLLPNCLHVFHIHCVDTWLQTHANCPLCRAEITGRSPANVVQLGVNQGESVVIDVRDDQVTRTPASANNANPVSSYTDSRTISQKERKKHKLCSMGDECINVRGKDDQFDVQPMRRSFSMDSLNDRQLYMAVQEILRQNPHFQGVGNGEGSSSSGSGRTHRSFFSFGGHCNSLKGAGPTIQNEQ